MIKCDPTSYSSGEIQRIGGDADCATTHGCCGNTCSPVSSASSPSFISLPHTLSLLAQTLEWGQTKACRAKSYVGNNRSPLMTQNSECKAEQKESIVACTVHSRHAMLSDSSHFCFIHLLTYSFHASQPFQNKGKRMQRARRGGWQASDLTAAIHASLTFIVLPNACRAST